GRLRVRIRVGRRGGHHEGPAGSTAQEGGGRAS
ncbi:hypothetical protein BN1708_019615, partial [Verticillium longisporum]